MPIDKVVHIKIIGECLNAVINGPFIPEWEFHTLFGLTKEEVNSISKAWPKVDHQNDVVKLAINASLGNLLGYPITSPEKWGAFISVSIEELEEIYSSWYKANYND